MRAPQDLSEQRNTELFVEHKSSIQILIEDPLWMDALNYLSGPIGFHCRHTIVEQNWVSFTEPFVNEARIAELSQDETIFNLEIEYRSGFPPSIKYQKYEL